LLRSSPISTSSRRSGRDQRNIAGLPAAKALWEPLAPTTRMTDSGPSVSIERQYRIDAAERYLCGSAYGPEGDRCADVRSSRPAQDAFCDRPLNGSPSRRHVVDALDHGDWNREVLPRSTRCRCDQFGGPTPWPRCLGALLDDRRNGVPKLGRRRDCRLRVRAGPARQLRLPSNGRAPTTTGRTSTNLESRNADPIVRTKPSP